MTQVSQVVGDKKTYVAIILDTSGSMGSCIKPTISGFNEQIQTIKSNCKDGGEWYTTVVKFNHHVDFACWNSPPEEVKELTEETYRPDGSTAMLDAVGLTITRLKSETNHEDPDTSYLLIVISDGWENASKEFTYALVGEMIQELKGTNRWTVTYLGSNQDLSVIQKQLNLDAGNVAHYDADSKGTSFAFAAASSGTANYMKCRSVGLTSVDSFYSSTGDIADLTKKATTEDAEEKS